MELEKTVCLDCGNVSRWYSYKWPSTKERRDHNRINRTTCPACGSTNVSNRDDAETMAPYRTLANLLTGSKGASMTDDNDNGTPKDLPAPTPISPPATPPPEAEPPPTPSQKSGHLRVVELETEITRKQRNCVLKLRELLAQAEQGKYLDLVVVTSTSPTEHSLHWTPLAGQETRFVGALHVMQKILLDSVTLTKG